jgi:hypothetical protein
MSDTRELEAQVARLAALVEEMKERMARLEGKPDGPRLGSIHSRRDLLKLGGAAALGAVGAAAMRAVPAAAATGDNVVAGHANTANATTTLSGASAGTPIEVLGVAAGDFSQADLNLALGPDGEFGGALQGLGGPSGAAAPDLRDGVDGWASGATAFGVYGLTDSGVGVTGESGIGIGLYARGSGRILQDPMPAGVPAYTPNEMEQVRDADGTLWLSNSTGAWRRATTFEVFPNGRRVYGTGATLLKGAKVLNVDATKKLNLSPSGVPAGAIAAWCAVQSFEPAVLSIYPAGTVDPGVGTWGQMGTAGISVQISYMMVPLSSSGKFSFTNMKTNARIFFDVWGYLSQSV